MSEHQNSSNANSKSENAKALEILNQRKVIEEEDKRFTKKLVFAVGIVLFLVLSTTTIYMATRDTFERDNRTFVVTQLERAQKAESAGQQQTAIDAYIAILDKMGDRKLTEADWITARQRATVQIENLKQVINEQAKVAAEELAARELKARQQAEAEQTQIRQTAEQLRLDNERRIRFENIRARQKEETEIEERRLTQVEEKKRLRAEALEAAKRKEDARKTEELNAKKKFQDKVNSILTEATLPKNDVLRFELSYNTDEVAWTIIALSDVGYISGDVYFYNGNERIKGSIWIVDNLKKGEFIKGKSTVDVWGLTRIVFSSKSWEEHLAKLKIEQDRAVRDLDRIIRQGQ